MTREEAAAKLFAVARTACCLQVKNGRPLDGPYYAIVDAANGVRATGNFTSADIVILRGMISARSYEKTPYHEAIVPVLQEALGVLEGLVTP